ncbi:hypothetical protein JCM5296_006080 [Sporobolomyces johnsonii]
MTETARPRNDPPSSWHAAFPTPSACLANSSLASIAADALRDLILAQPRLDQRDFLVVDVRRTDFENAFVAGAVNLPAHSFYPTLPTLLQSSRGSSPYRRVIFHCQSSNGRGPRCAGWYQDALNDAGIKQDVSESMVLEGGIKAWVESFGMDKELTVQL